jgi:8-oxo-dGTP pyrophosphatase MutT (NUDIX family)
MFIIHYKEQNAPKPNQPIVPSVHGVVINGKNKILFHKREDHHLWSFPGGKVELGESILDTLIREMNEEVGVRVVPDMFLGTYSSPNYVLSVGAAVFQPFLIAFRCKIVDGEVKITDESVDYRWASLEDFSSMQFFPLARELAECALGLRENPLTNLNI